MFVEPVDKNLNAKITICSFNGCNVVELSLNERQFINTMSNAVQLCLLVPWQPYTVTKQLQEVNVPAVVLQEMDLLKGQTTVYK